MKEICPDSRPPRSHQMQSHVARRISSKGRMNILLRESDPNKKAIHLPHLAILASIDATPSRQKLTSNWPCMSDLGHRQEYQPLQDHRRYHARL
jgi:hypothetical protein